MFKLNDDNGDDAMVRLGSSADVIRTLDLVDQQMLSTQVRCVMTYLSQTITGPHNIAHTRDAHLRHLNPVFQHGLSLPTTTYLRLLQEANIVTTYRAQKG